MKCPECGGHVTLDADPIDVEPYLIYCEACNWQRDSGDGYENPAVEKWWEDIKCKMSDAWDNVVCQIEDAMLDYPGGSDGV